MEEIRGFRALQMSTEELERSKEQLKGNYILGLESTGSIMTMLGKSLLLSDRIETLDEVIQFIDDIQLEDVERRIQHVFDPEMLAVTLVGRVEEHDARAVFEKLKNF